MSKYNCIVVLGATASGKTHLACELAFALNGEIISADSRQVYKQLNIGTGKDLNEYEINGKHIPFHLIDVIDPHTHFYLHDFIEGLRKAFEKISSLNKIPIICGGTGLYIDALRKDFSFTQIKENSDLRASLEHLTREDLLERLQKYPQHLWQHVDLNSKKRIIRGIEIAEHLQKSKQDLKQTGNLYKPYYIGITGDVLLRKKRISERLEKRLEEGLIVEVENLIQQGISHERLQFFGLEYKFVSKYILGEITKLEMISLLQTAIFQFAKRQATWFRKMEKEGVQISWVDSEVDITSLVERLKQLVKSSNF